MIAALFVQTNGVYFGLPNVDPWDEKRDARLYAGPWPVVAHPPCGRWSRLAKLVEMRGVPGRLAPGIAKAGEDGGCFEAALAAVRRWGGVLEHPAATAAFRAFGLPDPPAAGWQQCIDGGWVCQVEQGHYGHKCPKATWLYANVRSPPALRWGPSSATGYVQRMWSTERSKTPIPFRDVLIGMAEGAAGREAA